MSGCVGLSVLSPLCAGGLGGGLVVSGGWRPCLCLAGWVSVLWVGVWRPGCCVWLGLGWLFWGLLVPLTPFPEFTSPLFVALVCRVLGSPSVPRLPQDPTSSTCLEPACGAVVRAGCSSPGVVIWCCGCLARDPHTVVASVPRMIAVAAWVMVWPAGRPLLSCLTVCHPSSGW